MKLVILCGTEEWEGMYIDGQLVHQDHALRVHEVLEILADRKQTIESITYHNVDQELLNDCGSLPCSLDEALTTFGIV